MHAGLAGLPTHDDRGFDAGQGGLGLARRHSWDCALLDPAEHDLLFMQLSRYGMAAANLVRFDITDGT